MRLLKQTYEVAVNSEDEAKSYLERFRLESKEKGYTVGKVGYTYKTKKSKGEIIAEVWVCTCVAIFDELWSLEG